MVVPTNTDEELEAGVLTDSGRRGGQSCRDEVSAQWLTELKNR
jgi:hypothetical protein